VHFLNWVSFKNDNCFIYFTTALLALSLYSFGESGRDLQISLQFLALKGAFPETLAEEVLWSISTSVAAVTRDWDHHFDVSSILWEDFLEAITQVEEVVALGDLAFQDFGLDVEVRECRSHSLYLFTASDSVIWNASLRIYRFKVPLRNRCRFLKRLLVAVLWLGLRRLIRSYSAYLFSPQCRYH